MSSISNYNTARRATIQVQNKQKIIKWLENRENKTDDEIAALECAKKDNKSKVGLIYFIFLMVLIFGTVILGINMNDDDAIMTIAFIMPIIVIISVIIIIMVNSILNRDFNKLVERIARFTDLYLSEYRSDFATKFDGANINDYDFAKNFVHYANQDRKEFEEKWAEIKPFTKIEKMKKKLIVWICLLAIFGLPLFIIFFGYPKYLEIKYPEKLEYSDYKIIETTTKDAEIIVTIEYEIDGQRYTIDVKVDEYTWKISGDLYYNSKNPQKIIYDER